jgi:hypothetical protein
MNINESKEHAIVSAEERLSQHTGHHQGDDSNIIPFPATQVSPPQLKSMERQTFSLKVRQALQKARRTVQSFMHITHRKKHTETRKAA